MADWWRVCVALVVVVMWSGCFAEEAPDPRAAQGGDDPEAGGGGNGTKGPKAGVNDTLEKARDPSGGNSSAGPPEWFLLTTSADEDGETAGFAFTLPNGTVHAHRHYDEGSQIAFEVVPVVPDGMAESFESVSIHVFAESVDESGESYLRDVHARLRNVPDNEVYEEPFVIRLTVAYDGDDDPSIAPGDTLRFLVGAAASEEFEFGLALRFFGEDPSEDGLGSDDVASFLDATEGMERVDVPRAGTGSIYAYAAESHYRGLTSSGYGAGTGHMDVDVRGNGDVGFTMDLSYEVTAPSTYTTAYLRAAGDNAVGKAEAVLSMADSDRSAEEDIFSVGPVYTAYGVSLYGRESGPGGVTMSLSLDGRGERLYVIATAVIFGASLEDVFGIDLE